MSITRRITHSGTIDCWGMSTRRNVPTFGNRTPATRTIQITEPNVMPSRMNWRDAGTRPKSSVLAQPSVVVTILSANREPSAKSAARIATERKPEEGCVSRALRRTRLALRIRIERQGLTRANAGASRSGRRLH